MFFYKLGIFYTPFAKPAKAISSNIYKTKNTLPLTVYKNGILFLKKRFKTMI